MSIKLSICIPTYNRGKFLPELFESILSDIDEENRGVIEVCVSDNASNDNTEEVILGYRKRFEERGVKFTHFRWQTNMGADRNFLKVVEIASGEYCWLMGSDDRIEGGALRYILEKLEENPNIAGISLNRLAYDYHFKNVLRERLVSNKKLQDDTLLRSIDDIVYYLGDYFGYISGQIVNKRLWDEVVEENKDKISDYLNAYVHIFVILNMIKKNGCWYYISKPLVKCRSGNDSFLSEGYFKRIKIDIEGYEKIVGDVIGRDNKIYHRLNEKISIVQVFNGILTVKMENKIKGWYFKLLILCIKYYYRYPKFWFKTFILLITPTFVLKILRFIYRKTLKRFIKNYGQ